MKHQQSIGNISAETANDRNITKGYIYYRHVPPKKSDKLRDKSIAETSVFILFEERAPIFPEKICNIADLSSYLQSAQAVSFRHINMTRGKRRKRSCPTE